MPAEKDIANPHLLSNISPPYRNSSGFDEFWVGARLEHIELGTHSFSGSRYEGLGQWRDADTYRNFWG